MKQFSFINWTATATAMTLLAGTAGATPTYPEVTRLAAVEPVIRQCTQLERSAGIEAEKCGKMTLAEVVKTMFPGGADDD